MCLILRLQCFWYFVNRFRMVSIVFRHLFHSSAISWGHQKDAQRKTMQYGGGIWSRSAEGTWLVIKTMSHIAYCLEPIAIGGQGCPGKLFSLIFIGFHWFQDDLRLSWARKLYIYIYIYSLLAIGYWPIACLGSAYWGWPSAGSPSARSLQVCGGWHRGSRPVAGCGGLWRPVAGLSYPFKMMQ